MDIVYMAGFFDGEGSLGIYRGGGTRGCTLRTQVTQSISSEETALLLEAKERWGGSLSVMNRLGKRQAHNWQTSGANAVALITDLRPHLRLKAAQVDVALEWWAGRVSKPRDARGRSLALPPATIARDLAYAGRLVELKAV